jgi:hypothetical protein
LGAILGDASVCGDQIPAMIRIKEKPVILMPLGDSTNRADLAAAV